MNRQNWGGK